MKEQWNILTKCLLSAMCDVVGKVRGQQERHGLHREWSAIYKNEGTERILAKKGRNKDRKLKNELKRAAGKGQEWIYVEIKCQLDATEVFIAALIACSTCFGHHYAHHQELQHPAIRTHNPQLHTWPATWKPQHEIPQAATTVWYSWAPDDGHSGARNMLSKQ